MASEIDELFGQGVGAPKPRVGLVVALLSTGLALAVLGMACSAAPGGVLVLVAWMTVEKEIDRVDTGYLPQDVRPRLQRLQQVVYAGVMTILLLFALQGYLFVRGFYDELWRRALRAFVGALVGGDTGIAP